MRDSSLLIVLLISMLLTRCPNPPDDPQVEPCDEGYIQCIDDTTQCCPDTVGHQFSWEVWKFGKIGGTTSVLYSVDTGSNGNIFAVGDINTDSTRYDLVVFDGNEWSLRDVVFDFRGAPTSGELYAIKSINDSLIWIYGDLPLKGNGYEWTLLDYRIQGLPNVSIAPVQMWCESDDYCIFAGSEGRILAYESGEFSFLNSPIELSISSLSVDEGRYFATGWAESGQNSGRSALIFSADGANWEIQKSSNSFYPGANQSDPGLISSCISFGDTCYYTTPYGIYKFEPFSGSEMRMADQFQSKTSNITIHDISGNTQNDLLLLGGGQTLIHYDGYEWRKTQLDIAGVGVVFFDLEFYGDTVVLAGTDNTTRQAVVVIGSRI